MVPQLEQIQKLNTNDTGINNQGKKMTNRMPLVRFPFYIIQNGSPRSGSTFQFELLSVISFIKSPPNSIIDIFRSTMRTKDKDVASDLTDHILQNKSFVSKDHKDRYKSNIFKKDLFRDIAFFTSGTIQLKSSLHHQTRESLRNCSMCEIDYYQPIFGLSDEELTTIKQHMSLYEKLRQCCGLQMSKFERLRLHGCSVTRYQSHPDYPWCENNNMSAVELMYQADPIPNLLEKQAFSWKGVGTCDRTKAQVRSGKDFNGAKFQGCDSFAKQIQE